MNLKAKILGIQSEDLLKFQRTFRVDEEKPTDYDIYRGKLEKILRNIDTVIFAKDDYDPDEWMDDLSISDTNLRSVEFDYIDIGDIASVLNEATREFLSIGDYLTSWKILRRAVMIMDKFIAIYDKADKKGVRTNVIISISITRMYVFFSLAYGLRNFAHEGIRSMTKTIMEADVLKDHEKIPEMLGLLKVSLAIGDTELARKMSDFLSKFRKRKFSKENQGLLPLLKILLKVQLILEEANAGLIIEDRLRKADAAVKELQKLDMAGDT